MPPPDDTLLLKVDQAEAYCADAYVLIRNGKTEKVADASKASVVGAISEVADFRAFLEQLAGRVRGAKLLIALGDSTTANLSNWPSKVFVRMARWHHCVVINLANWDVSAGHHANQLEYLLEWASQQAASDVQVVFLGGVVDVAQRIKFYSRFLDSAYWTPMLPDEIELESHKYGSELARLCQDVPAEDELVHRWIARRTLAALKILARLCAEAGAGFSAILQPLCYPGLCPGYDQVLQQLYNREASTKEFESWCREREYFPDLSCWCSEAMRPILEMLRKAWHPPGSSTRYCSFVDQSMLFSEIADVSCFQRNFDAVHYSQLGVSLLADAITALLPWPAPNLRDRLNLRHGTPVAFGRLEGAVAIPLESGQGAIFLREDPDIGLHRLVQTQIQVTPDEACTVEVVCRAAGRSLLRIELNNIEVDMYACAEFDLRQNIVLDDDGDAAIETIEGDWVRCFLQMIPASPSMALAITVLNEEGTVRYQGSGQAGVHIQAMALHQSTRHAHAGLCPAQNCPAAWSIAVRAAAKRDPAFRINLAKSLKEEGKPEEAVALLRRAIAGGGADPYVHFALGEILMQSSDLAGAEQAFRKANQLNPRAASFRNNLAGVLNARGKYSEAVGLLEPAIADGSADAATTHFFGQILERSGDLIRAEQAIRTAAELDPGSYRVSLAYLLNRVGQREEAASLLRQAIAAGSADPYVHFVLGQILMQSSDLAGAEQAFRKAAELNPGAASFRNNLAGTLNARGKYSEAAGVLEAAIADGGADAATIHFFSQILERSGDLVRAEQAIRTAAELDPGSYRVNLAYLLNRVGKREEAASLLRQAIAADSADPHVHFVLGEILMQASDLANAEQAFRKANQLDPDAVSFRNNLAGVLNARGMHSEAVRLLEPAVVDGSADAATIHFFGQILEQSGDLMRAEQAIRTAAARDSSSYRTSLAYLLNRVGQREEAASLLRQEIAAGSGDPYVHFVLGQILMQSSDLAGAEQAFRKAAELDPGAASFRDNLAGVLTALGKA